MAAPFRYIFAVSGMLLVGSVVFFALAVYNLFTPAPSVFLALTSFFLALFAFLIFAVGLLAHQGREILREMWRVRSELKQAAGGDS